jgi:hypothetical protein
MDGQKKTVVASEVAWVASRARDTDLRAQFERLARRRGRKKAVVAVGHTLLVIIYHRLRTGQPYAEHGADYFDTLDTTRITQHHVQRPGQLGYEVTITPKRQRNEDLRRNEALVERCALPCGTEGGIGQHATRFRCIKPPGIAVGPRCQG